MRLAHLVSQKKLFPEILRTLRHKDKLTEIMQRNRHRNWNETESRKKKGKANDRDRKAEKQS